MHKNTVQYKVEAVYNSTYTKTGSMSGRGCAQSHMYKNTVQYTVGAVQKSTHSTTQYTIM